MSSKANYFKLGVFVIAGFLLGIVALLLLGVGSNLKKPLLVETYLDQSVQGLEVGSKVKYRGVDMGNVYAIGFARDRYEEGKPPEQQKGYIMIEVAVSESVYAHEGREAFLKVLKADVSRGLRFRLNALGITGLSFLELDYVNPYRYPSLEVTWVPENFYIPSAPGTLMKLLSSVEQVFRKLEDVNVGLVLTNLNRLLTTAEGEVRSAQLARISGEATNLLSELRETNRSLQAMLNDPQLRGIPTHVVAAIEQVRTKIERLDLDGIVARADRTLAAAEGLLAGKDADLASILTNLRALSENLRAVSEVARLQPSGLLLGAPPRTVQPNP